MTNLGLTNGCTAAVEHADTRVVTQLETLLAAAAIAGNWEQAVVHRCAWCGGIPDRDGRYGARRPLSAVTVTTDGMCPTCGCKALARLASRARARVAAGDAGHQPLPTACAVDAD